MYFFSIFSATLMSEFEPVISIGIYVIPLITVELSILPILIFAFEIRFIYLILLPPFPIMKGIDC